MRILQKSSQILIVTEQRSTGDWKKCGFACFIACFCFVESIFCPQTVLRQYPQRFPPSDATRSDAPPVSKRVTLKYWHQLISIPGRLRSFCRFRFSRFRCGFLFVLIACAGLILRDCLRSPDALIPGTPGLAATVPLLNAWTIAHNSDSLRDGMLDYWNAGIFAPEEGTFAYSEPQPATLIVAPVLWLTGSPALAYNLYLVVSLILNGWLTFLFLRQVRVRNMIAASAGLAMLLHPLALQQRDVLQLVPMWPIIWVWTAAFQLYCCPRKTTGIYLGIAGATAFFTSVHQGAFMLLATLPAGVVLVPSKVSGRWLKAVAVSVLTFAVVVGPFLWPMYNRLTAMNFSRTPETVQSLSAKISDYSVTPSQALLPVKPPGTRGWSLNPGYVRCVIATFGIVFVLFGRSRRRTRWTLFLLLVGTVSLLFSLGLNLQIAGWTPWQTVSRLVPGFSLVRSTFRFAYFVQMSVILIAALGLDSLDRLYLRKFTNPFARTSFRLLTVVFATLSAFEVPPSRGSVVGVSNLNDPPPWAEFLRDHSAGGGSVLCLPYAAGNSVQDFELTTRWMLLSTEFGLPIVNGYSGFFPQSHFDFQKELSTDAFSEASIGMMRRSDVRYVVVHLKLMDHEQVVPEELFSPVFQDSGSVIVYELIP